MAGGVAFLSSSFSIEKVLKFMVIFCYYLFYYSLDLSFLCGIVVDG
jgi:hypothetical protein